MTFLSGSTQGLKPIFESTELIFSYFTKLAQYQKNATYTLYPLYPKPLFSNKHLITQRV